MSQTCTFALSPYEFRGWKKDSDLFTHEDCFTLKLGNSVNDIFFQFQASVFLTYLHVSIQMSLMVNLTVLFSSYCIVIKPPDDGDGLTQSGKVCCGSKEFTEQKTKQKSLLF